MLGIVQPAPFSRAALECGLYGAIEVGLKAFDLVGSPAALAATIWSADHSSVRPYRVARHVTTPFRNANHLEDLFHARDKTISCFGHVAPKEMIAPAPNRSFPISRLMNAA